MDSRWNDIEAARCADELALRVYTSRLLGSDKSLVMHGGGNTSVKLTQSSLFGEDKEVLYVKGSGCSLETIEPSDFVPVRLAGVRRLIEHHILSPRRMAEEFSAQALRPGVPSIESILHAVLPYKYVEHTHADTVLAIANTVDGAYHLQQAFGDQVLIVPYHNSGLALAKACAAIFTAQATYRTVGMVLLHHGVLAFGHSARESYEHMIALVSAAEAYLNRQGAWTLSSPPLAASSSPRPTAVAIAALRRDISDAAGFSMLLTRRDDSLIHSFIHHPDVAQITQQGSATPHHAIFTKRVPSLSTNVMAFSAQYRQYLHENHDVPADGLFPDLAPRITLTPEFGLCAAGISAYHANAAAEIYYHTIEIISRASLLDTYQALPPPEILAAEVEYGGFERILLSCRTPANQWLGEVALVTHASSPVGQQCIAALLAGGAAVVGLEGGMAMANRYHTPAYCGIANVADKMISGYVLEQLVDTFGGLDMLITDNLSFIAPCLPLLKLSPARGRVTFLAPHDQSLTTFYQTVTALASDDIRLNAVSYTRAESERAARLAAELCGPLFAGTIGAVVPVHGLNPAS